MEQKEKSFYSIGSNGKLYHTAPPCNALKIIFRKQTAEPRTREVVGFTLTVELEFFIKVLEREPRSVEISPLLNIEA